MVPNFNYKSKQKILSTMLKVCVVLSNSDFKYLHKKIPFNEHDTLICISSSIVYRGNSRRTFFLPLCNTTMLSFILL